MDKILTLREAAKYLKVAPITLYRRARRGEVPAAKLGRSWRFHLGQLDEWFETKAGHPRRDEEGSPESFRHLSARESRGVLEFIDRLKADFPSLKQVILYGSRARGDFKAFSDIDLLIVLREATEETLKKLAGLANGFNLEKDLLLQTIGISQEEWKNPSFRTFLLVERIRREGITLYG